MTQLKIRGSTQILDKSIPAIKLVDNLNLPLSQLQDGARLFLKDLNGNLNLSGKRIVNSGFPQNASDLVTKSYVDAIAFGGGPGPGITINYTNPVQGDLLFISDPMTLLYENTSLQNLINSRDFVFDGGIY